MPAAPTVYVCAQDRGHGPTAPGPERLLVLINAPADGDRYDFDGELPGHRERAFQLLRDCGLQGPQLSLIVTPTSSLAGTTQVVGRVLEVALHKAHELGFELAHIVGGSASAPLPAPSPDGVQAMGRTNDAILYGGQAWLQVRGGDEAARDLARRLPSGNAACHGRSFAELFVEAGYDFYKIDPAFFAPAEVWVSNLDSGNTWHAGATDLALLDRLWRQAA